MLRKTPGKSLPLSVLEIVLILFLIIWLSWCKNHIVGLYNNVLFICTPLCLLTTRKTRSLWKDLIYCIEISQNFSYYNKGKWDKTQHKEYLVFLIFKTLKHHNWISRNFISYKECAFWILIISLNNVFFHCRSKCCNRFCWKFLP